MQIFTYKKRFSLFILLFILLLSPWLQAEPWRLNDAAGLPEWFSLSGEHRSRFENLDGQYRAAGNGGDQALVFRTLLKGEIKLDSVKFVGEMIDSRAESADSGTTLNTTIVNPTDLLQAHIAIPINNAFGTNSQSEFRLGRITMDVGSRRLVARNRYRNTINAFTGVDWQWTGSSKQQFRAFYTMPVQRLFDGNAIDNQAAFDKQDEEVTFWGVYYKPATLPWGIDGRDIAEVYFMGLQENDTPGRSTANRDIYTAGFRVFRKPAKSQFDFQIESMLQFGDSRSSTSSTIDLDHKAHFQHFEVGYTFNTYWSPQLLFQYDYASGDDDPDDGENNRFQTLFGARRFDFGPTSIYGAFARGNLSTPGLRLKLKPAAHVTSFISLRGFWLASADDAWTTARITPADDNSYIGTQIEGRIRWDVLPGNVRLETGLLHLFSGDVMDDANKNDSTYGYLQASFTF